MFVSVTSPIRSPSLARGRVVTLSTVDATVIADALDAAEELMFWKSVRDENASLTAELRDEYLHDGSGLENLADEADDDLGAEGRW